MNYPNLKKNFNAKKKLTDLGVIEDCQLCEKKNRLKVSTAVKITMSSYGRFSDYFFNIIYPIFLAVTYVWQKSLTERWLKITAWS